MESNSVFDLIRKFEKLSSEICSERPRLEHYKSTPQINILRPSILAIGEDPLILKNSIMTEQDILNIETQVHTLKKSISQVIISEKVVNSNKLLELVVCMADVLIKLNEIDVSGMKCMKIKKDSCISELKGMRTALIEFMRHNIPSANNSLLATFGESEHVSPLEQIVQEGPVDLSNKEANLIRVGEKYVPDVNLAGGDVNLPQCSKDVSVGGGQLASVHKLTQLFESKTRAGQSSASEAFSHISRGTKSSETPIDWDTEMHKLEATVNNLDEEAEISEIQELRERALKIISAVTGTLALEKRGESLLKHLKMLAILKKEEDKNNLLKFNKSEQSRRSAVDQESNANAAGSPLYPSEQYEINSNAHLAHTFARLDFYKSLIKKYLDTKPFSDLALHENDIDQHFSEFSNFIPHESMVEVYSEIQVSFKELKDLLVDNQFMELYETTSDEIKDELSRLDEKLNGSFHILENLDIETPELLVSVQTEIEDIKIEINTVCERLAGDATIAKLKDELFTKISAINGMLAQQREEREEIENSPE